jgi:hypothetical protein
MCLKYVKVDVSFLLRRLAQSHPTLKLVPWAACAVQLDGKRVPRALSAGRLFRTLPLPGKPDLGLHVNAMFAVRSDRSGLIDRDDAGGDAAVLSQWNLQLKSDLVAPLIAAALEWIARSADSTSANFYPAYFKLWPLEQDMQYVHEESSRLL